MSEGHPYDAVRNFEAALCKYTGARFAVTTNSCTMALLLAVAWHRKGGNFCWQDEQRAVSMPKRTYVGVPMAVKQAGCTPTFRDEDWTGEYQLQPLPVYDAARRFQMGMYKTGMQCVSFHASKILGHSQGGAILHNIGQADAWLRRMRFDGRTEGVAPKDDLFEEIGWHCYMSPGVAADLHLQLTKLPKRNADLPKDDYPDCSTLRCFQ